MADFDLSKITGREPPLVTDDERDAEIAYLSDVVANRDRELAALRARVAELEGDLNVARLQLGAQVCSECPAKARVAELEARPVAWCSEDCRLNGCEAARANYFASMNAVRGSDKQCRASGNKGGSRDG